jgi:hypothetical protein
MILIGHGGGLFAHQVLLEIFLSICVSYVYIKKKKISVSSKHDRLEAASSAVAQMLHQITDLCHKNGTDLEVRWTCFFLELGIGQRKKML